VGAGSEIEIQSAAGVLPGYLARPACGRGPGLLVLHGAAGLEPSTREACDRFARAGFVALCPDLYRGRPAAGAREAESLARALDAERAAGDLAAALHALYCEHALEGARVGAVGFGPGGQLALLAATRERRIGAVVDFYGCDAELALELSSLAVPVLGIFAGEDERVPAERVEALRRALAAAGARAHLHVEPGTRRGFMDEARPERHDAAAAARGWDLALAFLRAELRP
jgi:carboxymethylenebutenolidase